MDARIGAVQHAEAVFARLDFQVGKELAINQNRIAIDFRNPGRVGIGRNRIEELSLARQQAVIENQRQLVLALRQIEPVFEIVANEKRAKQSRIDIQTIDPQRVVVVPEHGRFLLVGIVVERGFSGHDPVFGIAVALRPGLSAMQVHHGPHRGFVGFGSVDGVIDGQEVLAGKRVRPFHQQRFARTRFKRRTESRRSKAPEPGGREIAVHFAGDCLRLDAIKRNVVLGIVRAGLESLGPGDFRDGQRIDELRKGVDIERHGHHRHGMR